MELLIAGIGVYTMYNLLNKNKESFDGVILDSESYEKPQKPDYSNILPLEETENELPADPQILEQQPKASLQDFISKNSLFFCWGNSSNFDTTSINCKLRYNRK